MRTIHRALVAVSLIALVMSGAASMAGAQSSQSYCSASESPDYYPCLPVVEGALKCSGLSFSVHVVGTDTYNLDADGDGVACEDEHGDPAALPASTTASPQATTAATTTSAETCGAVVFKTESVAPVKIVTPDGTVDETTTDQGTWKVEKKRVVFTPVANATLPTSINLEGVSNGNKVIITATANCNDGKLAQVGTSPQPTTGATPAATPSGTPAATPAATAAGTPAPTATPGDELAHTGSEASFLGWVGLSLIVAGIGITVAVAGPKERTAQ